MSLASSRSSVSQNATAKTSGAYLVTSWSNASASPDLSFSTKADDEFWTLIDMSANAEAADSLSSNVIDLPKNTPRTPFFNYRSANRFAVSRAAVSIRQSHYQKVPQKNHAR